MFTICCNRVIAVALNYLANTVPKPICASFVPSIPIIDPRISLRPIFNSHFCKSIFSDLRKNTLFIREFPIKRGKIDFEMIRGFFLIAARGIQNLADIFLFLLL